jgi:hypothetical protein
MISLLRRAERSVAKTKRMFDGVLRLVYGDATNASPSLDAMIFALLVSVSFRLNQAG